MSPSSKIKHLEGLRGLAALAVCIYHFLYAFYSNPITGATIHTPLQLFLYRFPLRVLVGGDAAVYIFFLLSGFVLSTRFFKTQDSSYVVKSAITRYFRLAIPVLASVTIAYLFLQFHVFSNSNIFIWSDVRWLNTFWQFKPELHVMLYQALIGVFINPPAVTAGPLSYNPILWTMYYEFFGSFLVFLFLLLFGKAKQRWIIYGILLLMFLNSFFLEFIMGMLFCDIYYSSIFGKKLKKFFLRPSLIYVLALVLGLFMITYTNPIKLTLLGYSIDSFINFYNLNHVIGSVLIFVSVWCLKPVKNFLSNSIIQYLGKISFSLYLLHFIVLGSISCVLFKFFIQYFGFNSSFILTFCLSLILIFISSSIFYKYVDRFSIIYPKKIVGMFLK